MEPYTQSDLLNDLGAWSLILVPGMVLLLCLLAVEALQRWPRATRAALWVVVALSAFGFLLLTLRPNPSVPPGTRMHPELNPVRSLFPLLTGRDDGTGVGQMKMVANLLLTVPLGAALTLVVGPRVAIVGVAVLALAVEVAQWAFALGRYADIGDWLLNSAGGAIGALIAWAMLRRVAARPIS